MRIPVRLNESMRIALLNGSAPPNIGGVENSLRCIATELLYRRHEVKIFCLQLKQDEPLRTECNGVEIIRCPYNSSRWPNLRAKQQLKAVSENLKLFLNIFKPDAIWSRSTIMGLGMVRTGYKTKLFNIFPTTAWMDSYGLCLNTAGLPLLRKLKKRLIWPLMYRYKYQMEKQLIRKCIPICFSDNMRKQLVRSHGLQKEEVHIIPPGVDMSRFSPSKGSEHALKLRRRYGLSENEPIVLYVGRLSTAKNIPALVKSLSYLDRSVRLVLVGEGEEKGRLQKYIAKVGRANQVLFAGEHYELLPAFYNIARVCVLPTTIESFGQTYLEALACGTPVVGFASDGEKVLTATEEIVKDRITGRVVYKISPKSLAEGINDILSMSESDYAAMSRNAIASVSERYSWGNFVEEMMKL